jgi:hypothetical protein
MAGLHLNPNGLVLSTEKGGSVKSNPPVFGGAPLFCFVLFQLKQELRL